MLKIGFIVNPYAGIGGAVGLKGSDGETTRDQAFSLGAKVMAPKRAEACLNEWLDYRDEITLYTASGPMGEWLCRKHGFLTQVVHEVAMPSTSEDTIKSVQALARVPVDFILFAGGDGTARNVYDGLCAEGLESQCQVLGIPAGCKIHSGVYAVTPEAAGKLVGALLRNELTAFRAADVVDLDEEAFRQDKVRVRHYGQLSVPAEHQYVQQTKVSGTEDESIVIADIAAFVAEEYEDELMVVGSGKTCRGIMDHFNLPNTLLGVDVIKNGELIAKDVNAQQLLALLKKEESAHLFVTAIGGQGHVFGRGNQQLSPAVLRQFPKARIHILATRTKIKALDGKPLLADTGDAELNAALAGFYPVITGYRDQILYRLGWEAVSQ